MRSDLRETTGQRPARRIAALCLCAAAAVAACAGPPDEPANPPADERVQPAGSAPIPGGAAAIRQFVAHYEPPPPGLPVRTIICLGGDLRTRPAATAAAFRTYPGATRVIFTGSPGNVGQQRDLAVAAGLPPDVAVLETMATDTPENAFYAAQLLGSRRAEPTLVVTNKFHLYRARMLFAHFGFTDLHMLASDPPGATVSAARIESEARNVRRNRFRIRFGRIPD